LSKRLIHLSSSNIIVQHFKKAASFIQVETRHIKPLQRQEQITVIVLDYGCVSMISDLFEVR
jgi:hypothetical protein